MFCDGVRRRDFLKLGAAGAGLTLPAFLRQEAAGAVDPKARGKSAIFVQLSGGPSHIDTFDLKPDAPAENRGTFNPIKTNVPGIEISEHLPKLAKCADKFAILRGVSHSLAAHEFGTKYMNTGNRPIPSLEFPGYGPVVSKELGGPPDLPPFVAIPDTPQRAGYLGVEYAPFSTTAVPQPGKAFEVRGIKLGQGLTIAEVEKRKGLLDGLDRTFRGFESQSDLVNGLDRFTQRAYDIISSPRSRQAFDITRESPAIAGQFGKSGFSQSCLLASRLVGADRAHAVGAVMAVAEDAAALDAELASLVEGLRAASAVTIRATKGQLLDRARRLEASPQGEAELLREVYTGPDFAEGVRAFLAKEKPAFRG